MSIHSITERIAGERKQREQANLLAAGTITACALHLTTVAAYLNETGRTDLAEGLCAVAGSISSIAEIVKPSLRGEGLQPIPPRDVMS